MADPLSVVAGVAGLLSLTIQVSDLYKHVHGIKNAPRDAQELVDELQSLRQVLLSLKVFLESQEMKGHKFKETSTLLGTIHGCQTKITELKLKVEKLINKHGLPQILERSKWYFHHEERVELITTLHRYLNIFQISLTIDGINLMSKSIDEIAQDVQGLKAAIPILTLSSQTIRQQVEKQLDHLQSILSQTSALAEKATKDSEILHRWDTKFRGIDPGPERDNETRKILDWLSPLDFHAKQRDTFARMEKGTGKWFFANQTFRDWVEGSQRIMWCPGIPGAGKSMLAYVSKLNMKIKTKLITIRSAAIDQLCRIYDTNDVAVAFIYCSHKEKDDQSSVNLVGSLIQQLASQKLNISKEIVTLYEHYRGQRWKMRPSLAEFSELLRFQATSYRRVFVVIDALDECDEANDTRDSLITELQKLPSNAQLLVTSRPIDNLGEALNCSNCLRIFAHKEDIELYINARLKAQPRLARHIKAEPTLKELIIETLAAKANEMFLLIQLQMDSLAQHDNRRDLHRALATLPEELDLIYNEAMERIRSQSRSKTKRAIQVLSWISCALTPLTVQALGRALAIEPDDTYFDEAALPDLDSLVTVCAGLVTVDQESQFIRLVHYTTQEYFERNGYFHFPNAHRDIATTCITYINFTHLPPKRSDTTDEYRYYFSFLIYSREDVFFEYAVKFWSHHAKCVLQDDLNDTIVRFLNQDSELHCLELHNHGYVVFRNSNWFTPREMYAGVNALWVAAMFGLEKVVLSLLDKGISVGKANGGCFYHDNLIGSKPLHGAALTGELAIARLLIEHQADIEATNARGETALHVAASKGHEGIIGFLLERGANIDTQDSDNYTPLARGVISSRLAAARILLEHNANTEVKLKNDETLLCFAAQWGESAMVKVLLEHNANIEAKNADGDTPLYCAAARSNCVEVVQVLLEHNANVEAKNMRGWTPLLCAVRRDIVEAVQLLLEHNANTKAKFENDKTPLRYAAQRRKSAMVKVLLEHNANIEAKNADGDTPLLCAAQFGYGEVVQILLEHNANIEAKNIKGNTPLLYATRFGHGEVIQILLEHNANIEAKNADGDTPLLHAVRRYRVSTAVVHVLLEHNANIEDKNACDDTPLHLAVENGDIEVVQVLLEHNANIEAKDAHNETPVLRAARFGHIKIVRILLEHNANIEAKTANGETPLYLAIRKECVEIVQLLLKYKADTEVLDNRSKDFLDYCKSRSEIEQFIIHHRQTLRE
ncbi:MAG: hypothetical protein Q9187_002567 [Circinaria calcarea]